MLPQFAASQIFKSIWIKFYTIMDFNFYNKIETAIVLNAENWNNSNILPI